MNPLTSTASDDDVERAMKDWLKFAKERSGRLKERESAKRISVAAADKSRRHEFGCSSKQSNRRLRPNSQLIGDGRGPSGSSRRSRSPSSHRDSGGSNQSLGCCNSQESDSVLSQCDPHHSDSTSQNPSP